MVKYFWAWTDDRDEYQEIGDRYGFLREPTECKLQEIAQEVMRDHKDDENAGDCIYIAKGTPIEAKDIAPDDMAMSLIQAAEENAFAKGYSNDDPLFKATKGDIRNLNKRIAKLFAEWADERAVIRWWCKLGAPKKYYREGTK